MNVWLIRFLTQIVAAAYTKIANVYSIFDITEEKCYTINLFHLASLMTDISTGPDRILSVLTRSSPKRDTNQGC